MTGIDWANWDSIAVPNGTCLPATQIEIMRAVTAGNVRAVLFDFDGTLSLIRSGWVDVMVPMMVEWLMALGTGEAEADIRHLVRQFVERLTGKQTIYQMIELARQVELRGGTPRDPLEYKHMYLDLLWERITGRIEALEQGRIAPEAMLVPGSITLLEVLKERGLKIFLASGTDEKFAAAEAELLGITPYVEGKVYGAIDDYKNYSKRMVIQRIVAENDIKDAQLLGFGDGYVEIEDVKMARGIAIGVATDEPDTFTFDRGCGVVQGDRNSAGAQRHLPVATALSRSMGLLHVVMIGVGAMIGAGIFVLTGIAAGVAGPALIFAFLLNGVVTSLTAMSYAELGSCFPEAGGGYLWVKQALPQPSGFLSGWMSWFAHAVACSLYAIAFGAFATKILSLVPAWNALEGNTLSAKAIAVLITLVFAYINYRGAEETGQAETVITIIKVLIIGVFCTTGLWTVLGCRENWSAHFTTFDAFMPNGLTGIAVAMGLTFIAFEGYEIIAQCGEEVRDPKRNIPRSIFISVIAVVPIYMLVGFVAIAGVAIPENYGGAAVTNWAYLGELRELAMIHAAEDFVRFGGLLFLIGGLFSTMSALNATIYSSSRVSFAMGRDHNLPAVFAKIHPIRKTPHVATAISAALIIVMAVALPIEDVASAADAMFLLLFVMVNIALINLRRHRPELDRGFKVPLVPLLPLVAIASNLGLAVFLFWHYRLGVGVTAAYIVVGIAVYLLYSRPKEADAKDIPTVYEKAQAITKADYQILVPIANPRSIAGLMQLANVLAAYKNAETTILNVVQVPPQLPASAAAGLLDAPKELIHKAEDVSLRGAASAAKKQAGPEPRTESPGPLPVTAMLKVSHNIPLAISDTVREKNVDLLVLGWRGRVTKRDYFFGNVLDATVFNAECDVAMMARPSSNFLDKAARIVVPVLVGCREARLALEVALALAAQSRLPVAAIHVTPRHQSEHGQIADALEGQVKDLQDVLDLSNVTRRIIHAKNVCGAILAEVNDDDIVVIEGLREGIFNRTFFGEVPERCARDLSNTVILTKTYPGNVVTWFQKLFGSRMPEPHTLGPGNR